MTVIETPSSRQMWAAYAAFAWALIFALMSFYWAAGGMIGASTLGEGMEALARARDPELLTITFVTGILKLVAAFLALTMVQPWGHRLPRWLLRTGAYGAGILFTLYALANAVDHLLMLTGSRAIPQLLGTTEAVRWHLFFWDPFWLIGGIFFILAARHYSRASGRNAVG